MKAAFKWAVFFVPKGYFCLCFGAVAFNTSDSALKLRSTPDFCPVQSV